MPCVSLGGTKHQARVYGQIIHIIIPADYVRKNEWCGTYMVRHAPAHLTLRLCDGRRRFQILCYVSTIWPELFGT
eukprot:scaffold623016_cov38-Prasinocladus_malaysianus.AAC.1